MKKMLRNKALKRIIPLLLAVVMMFGSCLTVFAAEGGSSDTTIDYQHLTQEQMYGLVNDFRSIINQEIYPVYKYQMFLYYWDNTTKTCSGIEFFVSEQPFGSYNTSGNWPAYCIFNQNDKSSRYYQFKVDGAGKITWSDILTVDPNGRKTVGDWRNQHDSSNYNLINDGDVERYTAIPSGVYDFFLVPPTPPILAAAVEEVGAETLMETWDQILGLIPLLTLFLVGLVAFWKGLQFLFERLRKA